MNNNVRFFLFKNRKKNILLILCFIEVIILIFKFKMNTNRFFNNNINNNLFNKLDNIKKSNFATIILFYSILLFYS